MRAIAVIPARMASSRFPGKPLKPLLGMPMIGHCLFRARLSEKISQAYVATCDVAIADYIKSIGGQIIMTSHSHRRAATRTAEALENLQQSERNDVDIVVMYQGDEPLISPKSISQLVESFEDESVRTANLLSRISDSDIFQDRNNVKAVITKTGRILYLSREPIPCDWVSTEYATRLLQTGIIAFRVEALREFNSMKEAYLEVSESIDMNRLIENGDKVKAVITDLPTIGVDTPEELGLAERLLEKDHTTPVYLNKEDVERCRD